MADNQDSVNRRDFMVKTAVVTGALGAAKELFAKPAKAAATSRVLGANDRINVGIIGDGEWSPTRGINMGMVQTLVSHLSPPSLDEEVRQVVKRITKAGITLSRAECLAEAQTRFNEKDLVRRRTIKLLEMVEIVIGEEAHEAGGNSYYEILKFCKNAKIRIALTA